MGVQRALESFFSVEARLKVPSALVVDFFSLFLTDVINLPSSDVSQSRTMATPPILFCNLPETGGFSGPHVLVFAVNRTPLYLAWEVDFFSLFKDSTFLFP